MTAEYKPLGQAVGILETCIVRRDGAHRGYARHVPRRGRFLVWRPGEDDLSDLVWYSFTEIEKHAPDLPGKAEEEAA